MNLILFFLFFLNQVITVFSASNYYEEGSNRGAYIRLSYGTMPQFFQYQVTSTSCLNPLHQRYIASIILLTVRGTKSNSASEGSSHHYWVVCFFNSFSLCCMQFQVLLLGSHMFIVVLCPIIMKPPPLHSSSSFHLSILSPINMTR